MLREKKVSIRYQLIVTVVLTLMPITFIFYFFVSRAITQMNAQIANANENTLRGYRNSIQEEILQIDSFFYGILEDGKKEELEEIFLEEHFLNPSAAVFAVASKGGDFLYSFNPIAEYTEERKEELKLLLKKWREEAAERQGWFIVTEGGASYMLRIFRAGEDEFFCMADLEKLSKRAQLEFGLESPVVFMNKNGEFLTTAVWARENRISRLGDNYFITEGEPPYMVVQESMFGLKILYGVRYQNNVGILKWLRRGPILFLASVTVLLAVLFIYMRYSFFKPLAELVETMKKIEADDLQCRTGRYSSKEFAQVNDTFNRMINTITNLKIESYERKLAAREAELAAEKAELTSLRMQIQPHFYLNCLKNIYGLAQMGSFQEIQDEILLLSKHLRYIFGLKSETVSLKEELKMCENYVQLQAIGRRNKSQCELDIPLELLELQVPPVSILSLVENAVKYGVVLDRELVITIKVSFLRMEDSKLADLKICDNGQGFPSEIIEQLNKGIQPTDSGEHIGIWNVIQRFHILYGKRFAINFWNHNGANIELMIQL